MRPAKHAHLPHTVYRIYAISGVLLYVGCTHDIKKRLIQHRAQGSDFMRLAARVTVEQFPDAASGYDAERYAIKTELPAFNVQGTGQTSPSAKPLLLEQHDPGYVARHARGAA